MKGGCLYAEKQKEFFGNNESVFVVHMGLEIEDIVCALTVRSCLTL